MKEFVMVHKYTGCVHVIMGYDVWSAMRANGLDYRYWKLENIF